jgi:uncharacterized protein YrrD
VDGGGGIPIEAGFAMSERFTAASGRTVVSRTTAEDLGKLAHIVVDVKRGSVASLVVKNGRKSLLAPWEQVTGFGPDAVLIADEAALEEPRDKGEQAAADGKLELVGKNALSDAGNNLGAVTDVAFDADTGAIQSIYVEDREEPASALLGVGSFAVIMREVGA